MPNLNDVVITPYDFAADPGYYLKVSAYFLKNPHYSPTAKVLYELLCDLSNRYKDVWPSQKTLCKWLGRSEKPFRAARRELEAGGLITVKHRGQGNTDHYTVHQIPLINNYNSADLEKVRQARNNSRSESAESAHYEESESKKHDSDSIGGNNRAERRFIQRQQQQKGPINFKKYTDVGKYAHMCSPNQT